MMVLKNSRRQKIGAEVLPQGGVHFRVWAPRRSRVGVVIEGGRGADRHPTRFDLEAEESGYFSGLVETAGAGTLYRFVPDNDEKLYPDPASRFQPEGPHGPSQVIDPGAFEWTDREWRGVEIKGQVIYEMHIGTFTREGTWAAAKQELDELADLGIGILEVMPIADFSGRFGWGYDGVNLFAPTRLYGEPDHLRSFVDRAHALGMGVILDVVYNHLGPDGNYLREFSEDYFSKRHDTEWGDAINFDGENSRPVREFFLANVAYWIEEFHLDGFRLDATHSIYDESPDHILTAITRRAREAAGGRSTIVVGENEPQHVRLIQPPERGGYGLNALWNDDFHHSAMVALTGRNEAYYTDYLGRPQEFISAIKYGFLYQGQWYRWQQQRRGTQDLTLPPTAYVNFIQNHDQIANSGRGERCHLLTSPGRYRAMTALLLLAPGVPMLFQGQEFASSSPFFYFADFEGELKRVVREGRNQSLTQFRSLATQETQSVLVDPGDPETFNASKLNFGERDLHAGIYQMHRDLLRLRRTETAFHVDRRGAVDGAVLGPEAFVLRFFGEGGNFGNDRLVLVNFGTDLYLNPSPEPLLAPPSDKQWGILWSSENPKYGGLGTPPLESTENWIIPGHAAVVMKPGKRSEIPEVSLVHPSINEGDSQEEV
jgi:maltooligosyltrehalose trehalohydrolase